MLINDSNTVSLLHFDESVSKDECGLQWNTNDELSLSTDIHRFGNSSLNTTRGGYLRGKSVLNFRDKDFTIDCWVYSTTANTDSINTIISTGYTGDPVLVIHQGCFEMWEDNELRPSFSTPVITNFENRWHHYACVRKDGKVYLFVDGKLQISGKWDNTRCAINSYPHIGMDIYANSANGNRLYYYLDELRISNIARWTTNFTPPMTSYGVKVHRLYEDKIDNYYGLLK